MRLRIRRSRTGLTRLLYGLPFLLGAAAIATLAYASREGMFVDGLVYAALGRNAAEGGHWLVPHLAPQLFDRFFEHPPAYFIYEGLVFRGIGTTWFTARLTLLPFVLGTVAVLWFALRAAEGRRAAFAACLLLLLTPPYLKWIHVPNLDVPLALCGAVAVFQAREGLCGPGARPWLVSGLAFGLALLFKGVFAAFIPLAILIFAWFSGTVRRLGSRWPWVGLALGLGLFALWPLALALHGEFEGFRAYLASGLTKSATPEGGFGLAYLERLVTRAPLQLVLAALAIAVLRRRADRTHVGWLLAAWCVAVLLPLHLRGAQHTHWLVCMYPALAGLAGIGAASLPKLVSRHATRAAWVAVPAIGLVVLLLPNPMPTARDRALYATLAEARTLPRQPEVFASVDEAVPAAPFLAANAFLGTPGARMETWQAVLDGLAQEGGEAWLFLCPRQARNALPAAARRRFDSRFEVLLRFEPEGLLAVGDRRLRRP